MSYKSVRNACLLIVFVLVAVIAPVIHGAHDTLDHHCTLCQLGRSSIGDVVEVQTVTDDFESPQRLRQVFVSTFDFHSYPSSGPRAPPA